MSRCGDIELPSDATLWARVQGGDEPAFEELFHRYANRVQAFCFRSVGSSTAAEDLVSVVFLQLWRRRADVSTHEGSLLPFLLTLADGCCRNHRRTLRRHARLVDRVHSQLAGAQTEPDVAEAADAKVTSEAQVQLVLAAMSGLRNEEQELVRLCLFGELSAEEAAVALGIPVGTAKSRLSRGRAKLRGALAPTPTSLGEPS